MDVLWPKGTGSARSWGRFGRVNPAGVVVPPAPDETWWVGLSSSREDLAGSPANKDAEMLQRVGQMATAANIPVPEMRAATMYHGYNSGLTWNAPSNSRVQWAVDNGFGGMMLNQKIGNWNDGSWQSWAQGIHDANYQAYLGTIKAMLDDPDNSLERFVVVMQHEPNNDFASTVSGAKAAADAWCGGTARFMRIAADFGDPRIIFSTCYVPNSGKNPRGWWNPRPALDALVGTTDAQRVMDATFCGCDPYTLPPNSGTASPRKPTPLQNQIGNALNEYESWGFTRHCFNEVGLSWAGGSTYPNGAPTGLQQAQHLADELWTWAKARGVECFCYFDVSAGADDVQGTSKTINTPEEYLTYSKITRNINPFPVP